MFNKSFCFPIIAGLVILLVIIGVTACFLGMKLGGVSKELELTKEELASCKPAPEEPLPEDLKPGTVGEDSESDLRPRVVNTWGKIKIIKEDRVVISGSGSNFADQNPRDLTVIFTDSTITREKESKAEYYGLKGLNYLKVGDTIAVNSVENIRGRTEFRASNITIL